MGTEPLEDYDRDDPEDVDRFARQVVKIAKLDDEGCYQTPNDFEECVELVKEKVLIPEPSESKFDEELDDLISRRVLLQLELKHGVKWEIDDDLL